MTKSKRWCPHIPMECTCRNGVCKHTDDNKKPRVKTIEQLIRERYG